ncbi:MULTISPECIES: 23S rRNA (uracil(1939)-C(5))-methyltransferase RlmD [unclassified Colwellia]|uniref:23S rRNA (uracil(1939)-C(5))-methyltransferase RlmD n=1 Tax=unclassified Colwellia TaxID=196834 RepID=UPI0015F747D2|nr:MULTISPECIES: 23S rRNA (uracil(1939)-C(5))-methyltransferase RlmD [unclassified Colwellia]MBA6377764.1 23S rRNA (uracil(1939)-C(5))-methyltransferase RlmD [Colwellia sp. BRX10-7]MBA6385432.1 23S rRNA (uracil(1939)-C(5))-methyltransferase RlmD [Colwellia sp. BRX10-2]MBA6400193.1 23S rRNA (uracil(1939)-C(5))-methyltransferase RlmD [Colwellia sp. BRX10-5]MBA6404072.1 23S rRNA (uracil(1939)-C(5))-methyltransferase RlmD [Colwellia sp. BRX10-1]
MANFFKATAKKQELGQEVSIKVTRLDINGCGVGLHNKKPIFIDGALPDEVVKVKVIEQKNKYSRGKLIDVSVANKRRVAAKCQHFLSCGGCDLQHLAISTQLDFKQQKVSDLFSRSNHEQSLPWQAPIVSQPWHYRRKARIGVQYNKAGQAIIGFRQRGSNQLINIKSCPVLIEPVNNIFLPLRTLLKKLSGKNAIGHIEVIATEKVTVVVRQLEPLTKQDKSHWQAFSDDFSCDVLFDLGKEVVTLDKATLTSLHYSLADNIVISFSSDNFIQVNHQVNKSMINLAIQWLNLTEQDIVLDLFCGLGNFSLPIAKKVAQVVGIEGVELMVSNAHKNALQNGLSNCEFYQADLNSHWKEEAWANKKYTKLLLDPARAGAYQALQQLVHLNINSVLYVSCDPATLAKDSELLLAQGYRIEKISLMDMFSQTKHIETMVLFVK